MKSSHFADKGSSVSISTCQTEDAVSAFSIRKGGKKTDKMDTQTRLRRRGWGVGGGVEHETTD